MDKSKGIYSIEKHVDKNVVPIYDKVKVHKEKNVQVWNALTYVVWEKEAHKVIDFFVRLSDKKEVTSGTV